MQMFISYCVCHWYTDKICMYVCIDVYVTGWTGVIKGRAVCMKVVIIRVRVSVILTHGNVHMHIVFVTGILTRYVCVTGWTGEAVCMTVVIKNLGLYLGCYWLHASAECNPSKILLAGASEKHFALFFLVACPINSQVWECWYWCRVCMTHEFIGHKKW